jgi:trimethylamine:corrinoid methyltransferase-like protein
LKDELLIWIAISPKASKAGVNCDADPREKWEAKGHKGIYKRAVGKYKNLKSDLHPQPLPKEMRREMTRIVKHADENLVGKLGK